MSFGLVLATILTALLAIISFAGHTARAQLPGSILANNFTTTEYYTNLTQPPQIKTRVKGKRAEPQSEGKYLLKELRIETFHPDGTPEVIIEAPECVYDYSSRTANSAGPLRMRTGDGQFTLSGVGFLWQPGEPNLIISNRVDTLIRPQPKSPAKK